MTDRPRNGRPVTFRWENSLPACSSSDPILGLRFTIEAAYGGRVLVDLIDLQPRRLAIGFAGALRRAAEPDGSIGAASVVKQHVQGYRRFFTYLRAYAPAVDGPEDLRAEHLDGFHADLEARGLTPIHRHTILAKAINALRGIDADRPGILNPVLRCRLAYTSSQSVGHSRPRDAYSPFVARQLRDAARADVAHIVRRLQDGPVLESDAVLRRVTATVHGIIAEHGRIGHDHPAFKSLYFMRLRRSLPVSRLVEDVHGRHYLTAADLPPFLVLLSLETGADRPVLVSAPLKADFDRRNLSCYGDQSWDLGPAVFRENVRRCHATVHFHPVGDAATERALRECSPQHCAPGRPATAATGQPSPDVQPRSALL